MPFFVFRGTGPAAEAFATHIDDILGCGEARVMEKLRQFLELRFGELELQENILIMWVWNYRRIARFRLH